jgi:thioredoxin reductase
VQATPPYDAIIIGGGPAGLTCAIFLARYRRRVLVIDGRKPRNYAARSLHGFLGQHGIPPSELLARGRAEAEESGAELREGTVREVERIGDVFEVRADIGTFPARRVVLAYGVRDTIPEIPGIESYYGVSVHHCPDCDGYEARDKRIGVIGWGAKTVALALKLLQWSDDIVVFTHGHEREWRKADYSKLLAENIAVKDEAIVALEGKDGVVQAAVLSTGERVPVGAIFFNIHVSRSCRLAEDMGCQCDPKRPNIKVDEHGKTTIEGVWAVGDIVKGSQLAITSAADGAVAAIDINLSLLPPSRRPTPRSKAPGRAQSPASQKA